MNKIYIGIDLHSTNSYFAAVNQDGDRLFHRRIPNRISAVDEVGSFSL